MLASVARNMSAAFRMAMTMESVVLASAAFTEVFYLDNVKNIVLYVQRPKFSGIFSVCMAAKRKFSSCPKIKLIRMPFK